MEQTAHAAPRAASGARQHAQQRAENVQNRIADRITTYAGSMQFVCSSG